MDVGVFAVFGVSSPGAVCGRAVEGVFIRWAEVDGTDGARISSGKSFNVAG